MYGTHATDIVAYTFNADVYDGPCTLAAVKVMYPLDYPLESSLSDYDTPEIILDFVARHVGIDRQDERSYDSSEFPKVVFGSDVESSDERCGGCGEPLIGD